METKSALYWIFPLACVLSAASAETIPAKPGQTVTLPCRAPSNTDVIVVEWTRPEMKQEYVFLFKDGWSDLHRQHPSYQNRVELKDREMKDGDVSMILKNVTRDDSGAYECRAVLGETKRRKRAILKTEPISIVHLEVHQSGDKEERGDEEGGDKQRGVKERGDKERGDKEGGDQQRGVKEGWNKDHVGLGVGLSSVPVFAFVVLIGLIICKRGHKSIYKSYFDSVDQTES